MPTELPNPVLEDPYSDGESPEPESEEKESKEEAAPETKPKDDGAATELLSKKFFGDKVPKVGDRCELEVVRVTESQVIAKKVAESDYDDEPDKEADPMDD